MGAIVRIALSRPYTFIVLALALVIIGPLCALRTPTDIFPNIRIPVIGVVWNYTGLPPDQMSGRMVTPFQRALTTTVNDIEHIEANSYNGVGIIKIYFQPSVDISVANAQVTAIAQTMTKQMPAGATPPLVINYDAATVPILQLGLSGEGLTEQNLGDLGINQVRTPLITVPGAAIPYPFGGKQRQVLIDVNPKAMQSLGLSANDVANALAAQNLITPVGTQKIGNFEYYIQLNNAPDRLDQLADLPIKSVNGAMVYIHDVAVVRDGNPPQTNIVHVNGTRSVILQVLKNGAASTLAIVEGIKNKIREMKDVWPPELKVSIVNDQSIFVRNAIHGVIVEGVIAALLTSLMILLFLGSWRSTLIITTSIPLAILGAIAALYFMGETLNIMTLGGLALAVGILVDDATVAIENINRHLEDGHDVTKAITDGMSQIVTPAFVSLLCICIVFVPMFFLPGVARFLFVPMAEAVVFAMIWSFILSQTLVPTLANYLLHKHDPKADHKKPKNPLIRFQHAFEARFETIRGKYRDLLQMALAHRPAFVLAFLGFVAATFLLTPFLGRNFFPAVDGGQILMHARAQVGTRVEDSATIFADIRSYIKKVIPPDEIDAMVDNIGFPISGINMTYNNTGVIGPQDGDIQVKLKENHKPTAGYIKQLREQLPREFPGVTFAFLPADIVSQILNFGAPAPINIQVVGNNLNDNFAYADKLLNRLRKIPGIADARIQQSRSYPTLAVDVDRTRAQYVGLNIRDVTNSLVVNLAGSSQVAPTFWLNPDNGVSYSIVMQTPQYQLDSLNALQALPISAPGASSLPILGGLANIKRTTSNAVFSQYNIQPMVQVYASLQGRDLGAVRKDVDRMLEDAKKELPRGVSVSLLGQVKVMDQAFFGLLFGLLAAFVLIYLLIVVNFQSWSDPLVIISALPAAISGIIWMLFVSRTTLSVPALTGAIMCMGVATANSVLVITFARERYAEHGDSVLAALEAGYIRFRPVIMTALAMVIGMLPMSLGLGEGGEQNAPLGRAVVGGLCFATVATLVFVPVVFSLVHKRKPVKGASGKPHAV